MFCFYLLGPANCTSETHQTFEIVRGPWTLRQRQVLALEAYHVELGEEYRVEVRKFRITPIKTVKTPYGSEESSFVATLTSLHKPFPRRKTWSTCQSKVTMTDNT